MLEAPDGEQDIFVWVNSLRSFGPKYAPDDFNKKVTLPKGAGDGLKLEAQKSWKMLLNQLFQMLCSLKKN